MTARLDLDGRALIITDGDRDQLDLRPSAEPGHLAIATSSAMGTFLEADDLAALRVWIDQQIGAPPLLVATEQLLEDFVRAAGDPTAIDAALDRFTAAAPE